MFSSYTGFISERTYLSPFTKDNREVYHISDYFNFFLSSFEGHVQGKTVVKRGFFVSNLEFVYFPGVKRLLLKIAIGKFYNRSNFTTEVKLHCRQNTHGGWSWGRVFSVLFWGHILMKTDVNLRFFVSKLEFLFFTWSKTPFTKDNHRKIL